MGKPFFCSNRISGISGIFHKEDFSIGNIGFFGKRSTFFPKKDQIHKDVSPAVSAELYRYHITILEGVSNGRD
jgi:hypothetical protein